MNCIHCGSGNTQKRGKNENGKPRTYCKDCTKWSRGEGAPRILLLDIETSHIHATLWDKGDQYVRPSQITQSWFILCWSAKWLFDEKVLSDVVTPKESLARDDRRVVTSIHKLMDQAEFIITQNGDWFDLRKLNWKFLKYQLPPNNHYYSIDALKKARQFLSPISLGLDEAGKELGFGEKDLMTERDWYEAEAGNKSALKKMSKYCDGDVWNLESWYLILRPWMKTHPNLAAYVDMYRDLEEDETTCPRCLAPINKSKFSKKWRTPAGRLYKSGSCPHCLAQLRISITK